MPSSQLRYACGKEIGRGAARVAHTDRVAHAQKEVKFAFSRVNFFICGRARLSKRREIPTFAQIRAGHAGHLAAAALVAD